MANNLIKSKIKIKIYDPKVQKNQIDFDLKYINKNVSKNLFKVYENYIQCLKETNVVAILTEWNEFNDYDWELIYDNMNKPAYIYDGRNIMNKEKLEKIGFKYIAIGKK